MRKSKSSFVPGMYRVEIVDDEEDELKASGICNSTDDLTAMINKLYLNNRQDYLNERTEYPVKVFRVEETEVGAGVVRSPVLASVVYSF